MAEIAFTVERDCACRFLPAPEFSGEEPVWTKVCGYHAAQRDKLAASQRRVEGLEKALRELRDHFLYRYMRTKKEGREYDLPQQVIDANAALSPKADK